MSNCRRGINIYVRNLDSITIAEDGQSATLGGGVYGDQLVRTLRANGKVAGNDPTRIHSATPWS